MSVLLFTSVLPTVTILAGMVAHFLDCESENISIQLLSCCMFPMYLCPSS